MAQEVLASQLVWNCLTAKEKKFEPEWEVRGIVMGVTARFDGLRRLLGERSFIETPLDLKQPGHLAEILVGPLAPDGAEEMVRALLKVEGYPETIPVVRSHASR